MYFHRGNGRRFGGGRPCRGASWAPKTDPGIKNYLQAREATEEKFKGMNTFRTINNPCPTIWGATIVGKDSNKVIGETVAMCIDNDCTAGTSGRHSLIENAKANNYDLFHIMYRIFQESPESDTEEKLEKLLP